MGKIVINGKFLGANLNGVHRTAAHYASLLIERARGTHDVHLVAPRAVAAPDDFPLLTPEVHKGRFGAGQGWEMLTLPAIARGALLVNFCNLAPLLHGNSVVMIHDAQTFLYPADYTGRQAAAYRALLPLIGRRARRILTVSDFSRHSLVDHNVGQLNKIDVVHNGTDHILDTPADPSIFDQFGIQRDGYVMAVGSAKGYKNMRRVFDAMRPLMDQNLQLVIAGGPGPEKYIAAGWTPPEGTIFTGFVSDGALRSLYTHARVFAFPSQTEGFGLPPIEAMQCQTPVVAASAGAMPEVCGDGAILVDPEDTQGWTEAIRTLVSDEGAAQSQTDRGTARAKTLSWQAAGDRLWQSIAPLV